MLDKTKRYLVVGLGLLGGTMKLADQDGLLKGVEADIDAPLPRQYAAQMIYNELAYSL